MALHNAASVQAMRSAPAYDVGRSGIVAWYYAIYNAAKAMIAATSGADPQQHTKAAVVWQDDIASRGLAVPPFNYCLTDLTSARVKTAIAAIRGSNPHDLNLTPADAVMAHGAVVSYLNGTASDYIKWECERKP